MLVTIITDASFCSETKAAGYGFWVASERGKYVGGGEFDKRSPPNSTIAEKAAVIKGLEGALKRRLIHKNDRILIQSDCIAALKFFESAEVESLDYFKIKDDYEIAKWFISLKKSLNLDFVYKHVKGHTFNEGSRYYVNRVCDKKARSAMRRQRKRIMLSNIKSVLLGDKSETNVSG